MADGFTEWVGKRREQNADALQRAEETGDPLAVEVTREGAAATEEFVSLYTQFFPDGLQIPNSD